MDHIKKTKLGNAESYYQTCNRNIKCKDEQWLQIVFKSLTRFLSISKGNCICIIF